MFVHPSEISGLIICVKLVFFNTKKFACQANLQLMRVLFNARCLSTIKKLTSGHTKIIMLIVNPTENDEEGHRSFTLKPVGWVAILDVSQQIFESVVHVTHCSNALFNRHRLNTLPMNFEPT